MSDAFYNSLANDATATLKEFGQKLQLQQPASAVKVDFYGVREKTVKTVFDSMSKVRVGDIIYVLEASATPEEGGRLNDRNESFVIIHPEPIKPAGVTVAWQVTVRHG